MMEKLSNIVLLLLMSLISVYGYALENRPNIGGLNLGANLNDVNDHFKSEVCKIVFLKADKSSIHGDIRVCNVETSIGKYQIKFDPNENVYEVVYTVYTNAMTEAKDYISNVIIQYNGKPKYSNEDTVLEYYWGDGVVKIDNTVHRAEEGEALFVIAQSTTESLSSKLLCGDKSIAEKISKKECEGSYIRILQRLVDVKKGKEAADWGL